MIYGIERAAKLREGLLLVPPAECAEVFKRGEADVALLPIGALGELGDYRIVTDFCIGASGAVRTVVLMSDRPMNEITRIFLDPHSRTSAKLVRILADDLWKISPEYTSNPDEADAFLFIGDKVFAKEGGFRNVWDLAVEWRKLSGLPMVFAVWVARQKVPPSQIAELEAALEYGTNHIAQAVKGREEEYALRYLTYRLPFRRGEKKSIRTFPTLARK